MQPDDSGRRHIALTADRDVSTPAAAAPATANVNASARLLEMLRAPACLVGADGRVTCLNASWRGLAGREDEQASPSWFDLIDPEDCADAVLQIRSAIAGGKEAGVECRLVNVGGASRWHLLNLQPAGDASEPGGDWLCLGTDIHHMRQREGALERLASVRADMLDISVDCIKLISPDGLLVDINKAGCQALGVPEGGPFDMPWLSLLPEEVREAGAAALAAARCGSFARFAGRSVLPDSAPQDWDNMLTPVIGENGETTAILCVSREVTAEQKARLELQRNEERLSIAAYVGGLGVWDFDLEQNTLFCDEQWYRIMGRDPRQPVRSLDEFRPFIHPDDVERATEVSQTASELIAKGEDYAILYRIVRPDGEIRWVRSGAGIQHTDGLPTRAVGFVIDVTDARRGEMALEDENRSLSDEKRLLERLSREDPLTGIANRRHLDLMLGQLLTEATFTVEPLCVGMIDIDHFKAYNDRYGHVAGDKALRDVAYALQAVTRRSDFVARFGGEEFSFVLTATDEPTPFLERFVAAVAELAIVHEDSPTGYLTISIGCTKFDYIEGLSAGQLLERCDAALYDAKMAGRNRYVLNGFSPDDGGASSAQ